MEEDHPMDEPAPKVALESLEKKEETAASVPDSHTLMDEMLNDSYTKMEEMLSDSKKSAPSTGFSMKESPTTEEKVEKVEPVEEETPEEARVKSILSGSFLEEEEEKPVEHPEVEAMQPISTLNQSNQPATTPYQQPQQQQIRPLPQDPLPRPPAQPQGNCEIQFKHQSRGFFGGKRSPLKVYCNGKEVCTLEQGERYSIVVPAPGVYDMYCKEEEEETSEEDVLSPKRSHNKKLSFNQPARFVKVKVAWKRRSEDNSNMDPKIEFHSHGVLEGVIG